jgi:HEAT repeat protein
MRMWQALVLGVLVAGCGPAAPPLAGGKPVAFWVEALADRDAGLRRQAVLKLGNVGPSDAAVYPALLGALKDPATAVRCEAILALLKFGPGAKEAMPALADLQQHDRDAKVRTYARKALAKLQDVP